jgi:hypothetical protein
MDQATIAAKIKEHEKAIEEDTARMNHLTSEISRVRQALAKPQELLTVAAIDIERRRGAITILREMLSVLP